jgi:hypothetical protein
MPAACIVPGKPRRVNTLRRTEHCKSQLKVGVLIMLIRSTIYIAGESAKKINIQLSKSKAGSEMALLFLFLWHS